MSNEKPLRKIQSFVRRSGRLSKAQAIGLNELWDDYGINPNGKLLNFNKLFLSPNNVTLEVGFGNGDSLLEMAIQNPNLNFLGVEVYEAGVGRLVNEASKKGINNLRVIKEDAIEVLENNIPDGSISNFQLFFPDPWHKKRHHKRRIVQKSFLDLLSRKLIGDGMVHVATDWEEYAEHIMETLESHPHFKNRAGDHMYSERPQYRPLTKFENRGQKLGHGVWDIIFTKTKGG